MDDDHLEGLSLKLGNSWEALARRLGFKKADIDGFNTSTAKILTMLQKWQERRGRDATYEVLRDALCHEHVGRKDLAEKFCFH